MHEQAKELLYEAMFSEGLLAMDEGREEEADAIFREARTTATKWFGEQDAVRTDGFVLYLSCACEDIR